ncbi:MAG TPA: glycerophosphodiester phosphodiesterase [Gemmatimonadaceae bacterium]
MPRRAPENSLPAFALALEAGADGLELDVHTTADGVVVVHHDPVLRDGRAIAAVPLAALRRYELARGVGIPTLQELMDLVDGRATLFVEIKASGIEIPVLQTLTSYRGAFALHSFDHAMIARAHRADPDVRLGILFEDAPLDVARSMAETGASDVWPHRSLASPELVSIVHAEGGHVIAWTVNDPMDAQHLAALGVDGLCSDDVTLLSH